MRVLTSERVEPKATPQDPRVFAPCCLSRVRLPPPRLGLRGQPCFKYPSLMPQGEEEALQAEGAVPSTPSPVLFSSSDDQAVALGEEECEEEIGGQGQGGAGGEGAKDKPRGFAAEEPGGWMDSTIASLEDKGDQ